MIINYILLCIAVVLVGLAVVLAINLYTDIRDSKRKS